ncbi:MAG: hypothetical protein ACYDAL_08135 [Candidatus Dormibacteraceae bacterium]
MNSVLEAMRFSWRVLLERPAVVVAPVGGGRAALVLSAPVVTVLSGRPAGGWLERHQARRSRLVFAADRETAVAYALRWRLNLARIRLAPGGVVSREHATRELAAATGRKGSWHST